MQRVTVEFTVDAATPEDARNAVFEDVLKAFLGALEEESRVVDFRLSE